MKIINTKQYFTYRADTTSNRVFFEILFFLSLIFLQRRFFWVIRSVQIRKHAQLISRESNIKKRITELTDIKRFSILNFFLLTCKSINVTVDKTDLICRKPNASSRHLGQCKKYFTVHTICMKKYEEIKHDARTEPSFSFSKSNGEGLQQLQ
ncbi:hypothetical protein BpHYR1_005442 [Brachionus plicatilis]|uniref:Uncharacterized protein n=1 Tax=Brachionus plicatilis TaxID=10195 RepID=A0A3M7Q2I0_BRAPC|nr:hypothetical protein BpHYR1_005442 [Brachionus plicatilis]